MSELHVLIAAGGTAGHVVPALSVADALRAAGCDVGFVGGDRAETDLVPAAGYPLHRIDAAGLDRRNPLKALRAALKAIGAVVASLRLIRRLAPDVVMGGGGYIAGVVGAAAVLTRTPLVLTEADSHLGVANRILSRFARSVCLAFPIEGLDSERFTVTGRPVPPPFTDREAARRRFAIPLDATCVLVTGGSLGARSINLAALEAFADDDFHVLHLAGVRDLDDLTAPRPDWTIAGYVDDFGEAVLACDLAVSRSGGSVFELAAHGAPAVLVPYPQAAGDHQAKNAEWMRAAGAAQVIPDPALTADLLGDTVRSLLADRDLLRRMSEASRSLARPDAADRTASLVMSAGRRRSA